MFLFIVQTFDFSESSSMNVLAGKYRKQKLRLKFFLKKFCFNQWEYSQLYMTYIFHETLIPWWYSRKRYTDYCDRMQSTIRQIYIGYCEQMMSPFWTIYQANTTHKLHICTIIFLSWILLNVGRTVHELYIPTNSKHRQKFTHAHTKAFS